VWGEAAAREVLAEAILLGVAQEFGQPDMAPRG